MCGIAGLALHPGATPSREVLTRLSQALAHRGPDGAGQHVIGGIALAHTRLAIIDLVTGDQPLFAGDATLIGNGEVYNHRELARDHALTLATGSDCEPPLHLYRRDGPGFAQQLRGMYAIAIADEGGRRLTLARDPFGIKPLYLVEHADGFAFASEPQALLAAGLATPRLRAESLEELLQLQFTTGAETIFEGITRVLPGETLTLTEGRIVARSRRAALPEGGPEAIGEAAALARLDQALAESVELHQRSDVPYGMFLSGGIDSASVLALMARLNQEPVLALTAGFDAPGGPDEREAAAAAAAAAGARHVAVEVTRAEVFRHLPAIVAAMDDPAADYAIIPTWFLAREARARGIKVVLSGEGGDEIFGGYGRYRAARRPWWLGGKAMRAHGAFDRLDVLRTPPRRWRDGIAAAEAAPLGARTRLQAAQAVDVADWLPNDLLIKLDRCLMAHGVEGRTPFLDPGVAAAAFRLPDALKLREGMGKWILRRWLSQHLPAARPFARKRGFTVPIGAWIAAEGERLGALVAEQPGVAAVARPDRVRALFRAAAGKREGFAAWNLLFLALWHNRHVLGRSAAGDVFEVLAEGGGG